MSKLIYIGNGAWQVGIPKRDLREDEIEKYGGQTHILSTGLYKLEEEKPVQPIKKRTIKEDDD